MKTSIQCILGQIYCNNCVTQKILVVPDYHCSLDIHKYNFIDTQQIKPTWITFTEECPSGSLRLAITSKVSFLNQATEK